MDKLKPLNEDMDARRWVQEFNLEHLDGDKHDPDCLTEWFSNAIQCGYDLGRKELSRLEKEKDAQYQTFGKWKKDYFKALSRRDEIIRKLVGACDKALEERIFGHPQVKAGAMEDFEVALAEARRVLEEK